ncbi:MAG: hypothetical protein GTO14_22530 [Anaerolineales bacterium]|nr:hypothetical protein [Anaerolineales bacterium]
MNYGNRFVPPPADAPTPQRPQIILLVIVFLLALLLIVNTVELALIIWQNFLQGEPVAVAQPSTNTVEPTASAQRATDEQEATEPAPSLAQTQQFIPPVRDCVSVDLSLTPYSSTVPSIVDSSTATYVAINVEEYASFTAYWKRELWEAALIGRVIRIEDFEKDKADYGKLSYPYLTGNGFLLDGDSSAQILADSSLLSNGTFIHFRDWGEGLAFGFPSGVPVAAFGFDYKPSETWHLTVNGCAIAIPEGRRGFIGVVMHDSNLLQFTLFSREDVQGGLSVDNVSYVEAESP